MSKSNNTWLYVVGGAAALVVGAVAYHYLSGGEDEDEYAMLKKDLDSMGDVAKQGNGTINLTDFINLFKIITKHAKKKITEVKAEFSKKRRELLDKDDAEYEKCVKEQMQVEEYVYQEVANQALNHHGIEEQEFMMS